MENIEEQLAEDAYSGYCEHRGWKSFNGEPLPRWSEVKEDIKSGWRAAVAAVLLAMERMDEQKLNEPR